MSKWLLAAAAAIAIVGIPVAIAASPSKEKPNPAGTAQSPDGSAAKACKAERASLGVEAFNKNGTNTI